MRSEFQFFMHEDDHKAFDEQIISNGGVRIKPGQHYDEIHLDIGCIQYERSMFQNDVLTAGRIAIATTDLDGRNNFSSSKGVEALYKKLRNWLKRRCINTLNVFNEKEEDPIYVPTKNFWVAPKALELCRDPSIRLKQFISTNAVFELQNMP